MEQNKTVEELIQEVANYATKDSIIGKLAQICVMQQDEIQTLQDNLRELDHWVTYQLRNEQK